RAGSRRAKSADSRGKIGQKDDTPRGCAPHKEQGTNAPRSASGKPKGPLARRALIHSPPLSPRVFAVTCLSMLVLAIAACGGGLFWQTEPCTGDWYGTRITPPASATIIEERCRSAFNPGFTLVFTMPPQALAEFQAAAPVTEW